MFIGYIYSFIAAILLGFVCAGYAMTEIVGNLKKELEKETVKTVVVRKNDARDVRSADFREAAAAAVIPASSPPAFRSENRFSPLYPDEDIPAGNVSFSVYYSRPPPFSA
jgi:hypothetical protein